MLLSLLLSPHLLMLQLISAVILNFRRIIILMPHTAKTIEERTETTKIFVYDLIYSLFVRCINLTLLLLDVNLGKCPKCSHKRTVISKLVTPNVTFCVPC